MAPTVAVTVDSMVVALATDVSVTEATPFDVPAVTVFCAEAAAEVLLSVPAVAEKVTTVPSGTMFP